MQIRRVRTEAPDLRRYVEDCWIPYHESLSDTVTTQSITDKLEKQDVVNFYLDTLDSPADRLWVALVDAEDPTTPLSAVDATLAGFVQTALEPLRQRMAVDLGAIELYTGRRNDR